MNHSLTILLNSVTGSSIFLDSLVFVFAQFIPVLVVVIFLFSVLVSYRRTFFPIIISAVTLLLAPLVSSFLKILFGVSRPFEIYNTVDPVFFALDFGSFPSSHAFFFAALTTLSFYFMKRYRYFFVIMTFLIGLARVVAGVHFVFDILIGWLFGFLFAILMIYLNKKSTKILD